MHYRYVAALLAAVALAVVGSPFSPGASPGIAATASPTYPAQQCGTGTSGSSTLIVGFPTFTGSTVNYGRNTVTGFVNNDPAGIQYYNALVSVTQGPTTMSPSSTPIPANAVPPQFDTASLSHTLQFANEAPVTFEFTCHNLVRYTTYTFIATMYVTQQIPTSVPGSTLSLQTAYYFHGDFATGDNGKTRFYTGNANWHYIGANPPTPAVPTPTPRPPCCIK